jgi:CDP-paratose 2-epimerase
MRAHYPGWDITKNLRTTFEEIHEAWVKRVHA